MQINEIQRRKGMQEELDLIYKNTFKQDTSFTSDFSLLNSSQKSLKKINEIVPETSLLNNNFLNPSGEKMQINRMQEKNSNNNILYPQQNFLKTSVEEVSENYTELSDEVCDNFEFNLSDDLSMEEEIINTFKNKEGRSKETTSSEKDTNDILKKPKINRNRDDDCNYEWKVSPGKIVSLFRLRKLFRNSF